MSTPTSAVAIANKQTLANGAIAVTLRTNADPTSDFVATLYVTATTTDADVQTWVDAQKTAAAAQYDAMQAAHTTLASIT